MNSHTSSRYSKCAARIYDRLTRGDVLCVYYVSVERHRNYLERGSADNELSSEADELQKREI